MWYLTEVKTGKLFFLRGEKVSVGRIADLVLENDKSVSRVHGHLEPKKDHVMITDANSKYGTFLNDGIENLEALQKGVATRIVANDRIMFGRFENEWVLSKLYFKTFTSLLSEEKKEKLLKMFQSIGFDVIDAWQQGSTHLTMASTTAVTVKLLQALAAGIPIVTVKFWMEVVKAIAKNEPLPDYTMHMPTLSEPFLESVSLDLNSKRKQLFAGMVFVFMSNTQMESFKDIIELAGGSCLGLRGKQFKKTILLDNKYVAMQYNPSAQTQMSQSHKLMDVLKTFLKENKKRFVPEVEIGLALLHCSTVQHCNPALKFEALWKPDDAAQLKIKTSKVLVTETEEPIPAVLEVRHLNISATQSQNPGPSRVEVIPVRQPTVYAENTEPTVQQDSAVPTIIELEDSADEEMPSESTKSQANKRKPSLPTQKITPKPSAPKKARFEAIFDDNSELIVNEEEAAPVQKTTADKTANKVANAFERLKELRMNPAKKMPAQDGSSKTVKQPAKKIAEKGPSKNTPADIDAIAKSVESDDEVTFNFQGRKKKTQAKEIQAPRKSPVRELSNTNALSIASKGTSPRVARATLVAPRVALNPRNKRPAALDSEDDDEELFAFTSKKTKKDTVPVVSKPLIDSGSFSVTSPSSSSSTRIEPRQVPKIAVFSDIEFKTKLSGPWLCKKMGAVSLKLDGEEIKTEQIEDFRDEKTLKWIAKMKGGFGVNEIKIDLTARSVASPFKVATNTTPSSGKKNFKTFVKKNNYKQQTTIVRTHPGVVSMDL